MPLSFVGTCQDLTTYGCPKVSCGLFPSLGCFLVDGVRKLCSCQFPPVNTLTSYLSSVCDGSLLPDHNANGQASMFLSLGCYLYAVNQHTQLVFGGMVSMSNCIFDNASDNS